MHGFLHPKNKEKNISSYGFPTLISSKFVINGVDFGSKDLTFLDMTEKLNDIDGLLGMDFIENHVIYIDFPNQAFYIQKISAH